MRLMAVPVENRSPLHAAWHSVQHDEHDALLLHGGTGCGKTALSAVWAAAQSRGGARVVHLDAATHTAHAVTASLEQLALEATQHAPVAVVVRGLSSTPLYAQHRCMDTIARTLDAPRPAGGRCRMRVVLDEHAVDGCADVVSSVCVPLRVPPPTRGDIAAVLDAVLQRNPAFTDSVATCLARTCEGDWYRILHAAAKQLQASDTETDALHTVRLDAALQQQDLNGE